MGLGRGKIIKEGGLSRIEGLTGEHGQLWTYHSWAQWMKGLGWDELIKVTTPGESFEGATNVERVKQVAREDRIAAMSVSTRWKASTTTRRLARLASIRGVARAVQRDAHYFMPIRRTRMLRELDKEFTRPGEMAFFDDTKTLLAGRIEKLRSVARGRKILPRARAI